jgi:MSHA biogenesis protein MshL
MIFSKAVVVTIVAALTVLVSGCAGLAPYYAPQTVLNKIDGQKSAVLASRDKRPTHANVFHYNGLYVQQLSLAASVLPDWYHQPVAISFGEVALFKMMDNLFSRQRVNVEYRDGVKRQSLIRLSGEHLTQGNVLEAISAQTGYTFEATEDLVVFSKYQTRMFAVRVNGGSVRYSIGKTQLRQSGDRSATDGEVKSDLVASAGDEYSVVSGEINPLIDFKTGVDEVLGCQTPSGNKQTNTGHGDESDNTMQVCAQGASARLMPSSNAIIVRAVPSQMTQVARYVEQQHEVAMRQIRVNLTMVTIEVEKDTQLNLDLDILDEKLLGSAVGVKHVTSAFSSMSGGLGSRGKTLLQHKNGSELALEALSEQGSILQSSVLRAVLINHRVTQLNSVSKVSYISDRPQQVTVNVGTTRGIEQKVAQSGTLLYLLPNIGVKDAVVHISSSQSALIRLDKKGEGDSQVESPVVDDKLLNTTVILQPGRPVFVGGFSNDELSAMFSASGQVMPGLSRSSTDKNVETVMMIEMAYL